MSFVTKALSYLRVPAILFKMQPLMGFANKMVPGVSEGVADYRSSFRF